MTAYDRLGSGYDRGMWPLERLALRRLRRRLFPHAAGRVLELGVGTGVNLPLYAPAVRLLAMDASAEMLAHAAARLRQSTAGGGRVLPWRQGTAGGGRVLPGRQGTAGGGRVPPSRQGTPGGGRVPPWRQGAPGGAGVLAMVQADAAALPLVAGSVDRVYASLFFCSVPDPAAVLAEVWRVLRPGGWLILLEHVRGAGGLMRRLTDVLEAPWHRLSKSCHLNRETSSAVTAAGFRLVCASRHVGGIVQVIVARRPMADER